MATSTPRDGGNSRRSEQDQSTSFNYDLGQRFQQSHSNKSNSKGLSNSDMEAKSQGLQDSASLSGNYMSTIISFRTGKGKDRPNTLVGTVQLQGVDDMHKFKNTLWDDILSVHGCEALMRTDAPMNKLFQAIEDLKDTNTALKELEVRLEVLREQVPLALELKVKVPVIIAQTMQQRERQHGYIAGLPSSSQPDFLPRRKWFPYDLGGGQREIREEHRL